MGVDLYCLLVAQIEELRLLAGPALASEHQRAVFADKVAARARKLRAENQEDAPPLQLTANRPAASALPIPAPGSASEAPVLEVVPSSPKPRARREKKPPAPVLSAFERAQQEHQKRFEAAKAQSAAVLARARGEATA